MKRDRPSHVGQRPLGKLLRKAKSKSAPVGFLIFLKKESEAIDEEMK
jgi:hypothetical protein